MAGEISELHSMSAAPAAQACFVSFIVKKKSTRHEVSGAELQGMRGGSYSAPSPLTAERNNYPFRSPRTQPCSLESKLLPWPP